jgi:hypothetical protein
VLTRGIICCVLQDGDECVLDMMDRACPLIIERVLPNMPGPEKVIIIKAGLQEVAPKSC